MVVYYQWCSKTLDFIDDVLGKWGNGKERGHMAIDVGYDKELVWMVRLCKQVVKVPRLGS